MTKEEMAKLIPEIVDEMLKVMEAKLESHNKKDRFFMMANIAAAICTYPACAWLSKDAPLTVKEEFLLQVLGKAQDIMRLAHEKY